MTKIKEVVDLNWRTFLTRHWKVTLLLAWLGLTALAVSIGGVLAEPIDSPVGP